jgi:CDP-glucose 4,6-dehydratase
MSGAFSWRGQRVLLTGHTGFKGTWLMLLLQRLGAEVYGLSLAPDTNPNLFTAVGFSASDPDIGDIRDIARMRDAVARAQPTLAIHMAAQPLVRRSYREPVETLTANVMGTAHFLEALRAAPDLQAALVVTTDKVYRNLEDGVAFRENDPLGGHDPYSASKAAAEIVTTSYAQSFFDDRGIRIVSARAGNVIGGGDWSEDRLVPDVVRAVLRGESLLLRYPHATRPWQHVLDVAAGYVRFIEAAATMDDVPQALNFAPGPDDTLPVAAMAEAMLAGLGSAAGWRPAEGTFPREMQFLALDASLATHSIGWRPKLHARAAIEWTAQWYRRAQDGEDARALTLSQIERYEALP